MGVNWQRAESPAEYLCNPPSTTVTVWVENLQEGGGHEGEETKIRDKESFEQIKGAETERDQAGQE